MIKTTWILQNKLGGAYSTLDALKQACAEVDRPFVEVAVVPFNEEPPDIPPVQAPFVFYGYTTLILSVYSSERWRQGVFFNPEAFRPESYRRHYGDLYLNADLQLMTFAELDALEFSPEARIFLRPNDDCKRWSGQVMTFEAFREWFRGFRNMADLPVNAQSPLIYSPAKEILSEWRIFLVEGRCVGASLYQPTANPFVPREVIDFAESAAKIWTPVPVVVVDVAKTADGLFRIVELNCFNGCGFYAADVAAIVRSVSRYLER